MMTRLRSTTAGAVVVGLALTLIGVSGSPAAAVVDVGDGLHGAYDDCIAKFTAAGLRDLVDQLDKSTHVFEFRKSAGTVSRPDYLSGDDSTDGTGTGGVTYWNPDDKSPLPGNHIRDTCATLYHEMSHLADYDKGTNEPHECFYTQDGKRKSAGTTAGEVKATRKENQYRATQPHLKGDPRRTYNGTDPLPPDGTTCDPPPPPPPSRGCSVGCAIGAGDPHLKTFDGVHYDFQAVGEFILTTAAAGDLEVQGRQQAPSGVRTVSLYSAVAADVAGDRVGVYRRATALEVLHGTTVVDLSAGPKSLPRGGAVQAYGDGSVEIRWPDGSALDVRPSGAASVSLSIHLAEARRGTVRGLFGNFDGKPDGDLVVRDGAAIPQQPTFEDLYPRYADSWRIAAAASLFVYGPGQSTDTFTDRSLPDRPIRAADLPHRAAAEAVCRQAGVTEERALEWCVLDVGLTGDPAFARDAVVTQRLTTAAGATTLTVDRAGGTARLTLPGTAGQRIFVDVVSSDLPDQCGALTLLDPADRYVAGGCIIGGTGFIDGTILPATGTYAVVLDPGGTATGRATVRVIPGTDQRLPIVADGPAVDVEIRQPGAVAELRFSATAGTKVFVDVPASNLPDQCGPLTLRDPAGRYLAGGCIIGGRGIIDGTVLTTSGEHTVLIDPGDRRIGTAQVRLSLAHDKSGTITVNGPAVTVTVAQAGAVSRMRFTGTAGQRVILEVTASTLSDQCGVLTLRDPAGDFVGGGCIINGTGSIPAMVLPASGQYEITVDPAARGTGNAQLRLRT